MDLEALRRLLVSKPGAVEDQPFGPDVLVYKVGGRMFAATRCGEYLGRTAERFSLSVAAQPRQTITLKLDPLHGQLLRAQNASVLPGYHMNKDHWNTVVLDGGVVDDELADWIDESYSLVVERLPRRERERLPRGGQRSSENA
jgi:predicted DNA-binding protein (MmcQ/YjbR family)